MAEPRGTGRRRRTPVRRRNSADTASVAQIGWPRRIGVGLAIVVLGGTVVLAGSGALDSDARGPDDPTPGASASPVDPSSGAPAALEAPTIEGADTVLTREATWTLVVLLPEDVPDRSGSRLVVYRADRQVTDRRVSERSRMRIKLELRRGENEFTAALVGSGGESPPSAVVTVTRDDVAPRVRIQSPAGGALINATTTFVRGTAEPGTTIRVRNERSGDSDEALVGAAGIFEMELDLAPGVNQLVVRSEDAAGNASVDQVTVTRGEGRAEARLSLSRSSFPIDQLPTTISLQVTILDADGAPVDGAPVTFSLAPPGLPTSTYRTTSSDGTASWQGVTLPREGAVDGNGLATVQVTLADGTIVREAAAFRFH